MEPNRELLYADWHAIQIVLRHAEAAVEGARRARQVARDVCQRSAMLRQQARLGRTAALKAMRAEKAG